MPLKWLPKQTFLYTLHHVTLSMNIILLNGTDKFPLTAHENRIDEWVSLRTWLPCVSFEELRVSIAHILSSIHLTIDIFLLRCAIFPTFTVGRVWKMEILYATLRLWILLYDCFLSFIAKTMCSVYTTRFHSSMVRTSSSFDEKTLWESDITSKKKTISSSLHRIKIISVGLYTCASEQHKKTPILLQKTEKVKTTVASWKAKQIRLFKRKKKELDLWIVA